MTARPLVSCIATTIDRPHFVTQMLRCFRRQTYPEKELILVDGGHNPIDALCANVPGVRYVRAVPETSVGASLNIAAEHSSGRVLQKFDDDDYYHPSFIERAVTALLRRRRLDVIVAWDCFYVLSRGHSRLRFSGHGWGAGGTLCFARKLWERTKFRDGRAEDYFFFHDSGATLERVCGSPELYIYVRHGKNYWAAHDTFHQYPRTHLRAVDVVDPEDVPFYLELTTRPR
jgi:glycosyltransferase involved in cell wall biosynthesis